MLITDSYRELNQQLHATNAKYGTSGKKYVSEVLHCINELEAMTVLDYGCGKGTLKAKLPEVEIAEYDPAIPGKDARPQPAELVVCTDVLEHIEPENLDEVLADINQLSLSGVFFTVCTVKAGKKLADGRNAHLIVENRDWWIERLEKYFTTVAVKDKGDTFCYLGQPKKKIELGALKVRACMTPELRTGQMAHALGLGIERLKPAEEHRKEALICCYGPSLKEKWQDIKLFHAEYPQGRDIFTCSGAHDFLFDKGILPTFHVECDPRKHKVKTLNLVNPVTTYLLASVCSPEMFERTKNNRRKLWHTSSSKTESWLAKNYPGESVLDVGSTVGLASICLAYIMGYRRMFVYGMDCCFDSEGHHAAAHYGKQQGEIEVECNGRMFKTSIQMVSQAREFLRLMTQLEGATVIVIGDGLLSEMIKQGRKDYDDANGRGGRDRVLSHDDTGLGSNERERLPGFQEEALHPLHLAG